MIRKKYAYIDFSSMYIYFISPVCNQMGSITQYICSLKITHKYLDFLVTKKIKISFFLNLDGWKDGL